MTLHNRICLLPVRKLVQNAHFLAPIIDTFFNYVFVVENVIHHWTKFNVSFPKSKLLMCCMGRSSTIIIYVVDKCRGSAHASCCYHKIVWVVFNGCKIVCRNSPKCLKWIMNIFIRTMNLSDSWPTDDEWKCIWAHGQPRVVNQAST